MNQEGTKIFRHVYFGFATFEIPSRFGIYTNNSGDGRAEHALSEMADMRGSGVVCDDKCGCPSPCPGGTACSCVSGAGDETTVDHKQCSCGEHCGCNPCTCSKSETRGTGKAFCRCGAGCTCPTCAA